MNTGTVDEAQSSKKSDVTSPRPFILDLIGPFVVHFCNGIARIHAPTCLDHHANVLTDSDDVALWGLTTPASTGGCQCGYVYTLTTEKEFPKGGKRHCTSPDQMLVLPFTMRPIKASSCNLVLEVPVPDTIVALLADHIWIHIGNSKVWFYDPIDDDDSWKYVDSDRARGLRFMYDEWPGKPKIELIEYPDPEPPGLKDKLNKIHFEALGFDAKPYQPHYSLTLRFASNSTAPDEHHEDAYNCFQMMRGLIPETLMWRTDFDDSFATVATAGSFARMKAMLHGGAHPVDCGAAVLVVQDRL